MLTNPFKVTPRLAVIAGLALVSVAIAGLSVSQYVASRAGTALQSGVVGNAAPSVDAVVPSDAPGSGSVALPAAGFTLNEGATRSLYVRGTVSDPNGCSDLNGVALTVYRPGVAFGGTDGMDANGVLGQGGSFTSNTWATSATKLQYPDSTVIDQGGRRLFVTDGGNNRVLQYDLNADGVPATTASHVLGQADFVHGSVNRGGAVGAGTLNTPAGLTWDASNSRLWVADYLNHRILGYELAGGITDGMAASHVLGQADFTHNAANRGASVVANSMYFPNSVAWDAINNRLIVADSYNNRIITFDFSSGITDGMSPTHVLGQVDYIHRAANRGASVAANTLSFPSGMFWDAFNARLYVADQFNNRVLSFDLATGLVDGVSASHVLGQADFTHGAANRGGSLGANTMSSPDRLDWDQAGSRLIVGDANSGTNNRLLIFELAGGLTDGMAAAHVLGQADFTHGAANRGGAVSANDFYTVAGFTWDSAHNRLFVVDNQNHRILWFNLDAGSTCAPDANNCYTATVAKAALAGCTGAGDNDATFEATIPVANFADPTDAGSPYAFQSWRADAVVTDAATLAGSLTADFEVQSLAAFSVAPALMDYGTIALGATSTQQTLTFTNTGNRGVNSNVRADGAMHSSLPGFADIPSAQTHYSVSQAAAWSAGTPVAATDSDVPLALPQQAADAGPAPTAPAYFYLKLPATGIRGTYTNTLFFTAYAR